MCSGELLAGQLAASMSGVIQDAWSGEQELRIKVIVNLAISYRVLTVIVTRSNQHLTYAPKQKSRAVGAIWGGC